MATTTTPSWKPKNNSLQVNEAEEEGLRAYVWGSYVCLLNVQTGVICSKTLDLLGIVLKAMVLHVPAS